MTARHLPEITPQIPSKPPTLATPALQSLLASLQPQLAARAAEHDRDGSFPHENFELLHAHGLIGLAAPHGYGGSAATLATARQVIRAVGYACPATALVLTMTYLQHRQINRSGSRWPQHLRELVGREAVDKGALINALRVEPELGSPTRGGLPGTAARRTADGGWSLDGHKLYSTGVPGLSWLSVWARTEEPDGAPPHIGNFLVPRHAPGVQVIESWDHIGLRASGSHEVLFRQVHLPAEHAVDIRPQSDWAHDALSPTDRDAAADQQAWMAVLLGTLYDAAAQAACDWILDFVRQRAPGSLGAPLATLSRVQETLGEIAGLLHTNHLVLNQLTDTTDDGAPPSLTDSGLVKWTVTHNAVAAVERALKLAGNHGLSRQNPLERHYRNVLCGPVHAPQDDALLVAAGRALLATGQASAPAATANAAIPAATAVTAVTARAYTPSPVPAARRSDSGGSHGLAALQQAQDAGREVVHWRLQAPLHLAVHQPQVDLGLEVGHGHDVQPVGKAAALEQGQRQQAQAHALCRAFHLQVAGVGIEVHTQLQALFGQRSTQAGTKATAIGVEHPARLAALGQLVAAFGPFALAAQHHQPGRPQDAAFDIAWQQLAPGLEHRRGIEFVQADALGQLRAPAGGDLRSQFGPLLSQIGQQRQQSEFTQALGQSESQTTRRGQVGRRQLAHHLHRLQHAAARLVESLTQRRGPQRLGLPVEQIGPQFAFEALYPARQNGLGQAQLLCGAAQGLAADHGDKSLDVFYFHAENVCQLR